jgi:hypothetical protein
MPKFRLIYEVTAPNANVAIYNVGGQTHAGFDMFKIQKVRGPRSKKAWGVFRDGVLIESSATAKHWTKSYAKKVMKIWTTSTKPGVYMIGEV